MSGEHASDELRSWIDSHRPSANGGGVYVVGDLAVAELTAIADRMDALASATEPTRATGDTSDGYHTFQQLYDQRSALLAALCNSIVIAINLAGVDESCYPNFVFKSRRLHGGEAVDGYFLVGINCVSDTDSPAKWATWHCEDKWWDANVAPELELAPEWDGHTARDALERLVAAFTPVDN